MTLPQELPVMTLPSATLFPQALLPLYIFEPRYRQMLRDALHSHRMFTVAMQKPGRMREIPCAVAGLGVIRVSVSHRDGTSHLILQGLTRVRLVETVQSRPYRVHRCEPLTTLENEGVVVDALVAKVLELAGSCLESGLGTPPFPLDNLAKKQGMDAQQLFSAGDVLRYLQQLREPAALADLATCALLPDPADRQRILEAVDLPERLRLLIRFLLVRLQTHGKK